MFSYYEDKKIANKVWDDKEVMVRQKYEATESVLVSIKKIQAKGGKQKKNEEKFGKRHFGYGAGTGNCSPGVGC